MIAIEVRHLSKTFRPRIPLWAKLPIRALQEVTFSAERGSILLLKGPNGSGKSTLLKILAGAILPDEGTFSLSGEVAFVHERPLGFYSRLSARENLEFYGNLRGLTKNNLKEKINSFAEILGFPELEPLPFYRLSEGMRQKTNLIRALIEETPILLLDEPFQHLDEKARAGFTRWLKEAVGRGRTILIALHHIHDEIAPDKVLHLEKGRLIS